MKYVPMVVGLVLLVLLLKWAVTVISPLMVFGAVMVAAGVLGVALATWSDHNQLW